MKTIKLVQTINDSGRLIRQEFYLNDELHNENGPAFRSWDDFDQLIRQEFWINGKLHNENGPAYRSWNNSILIRQEFWINGKQLSEAEFNSRNQKQTDYSGKIIEFDGVKYK